MKKYRGILFSMALMIMISLLAFLVGAVSSAETDRITSLPGQPNVPFKQYSGYVTVNESAGRALFYWLTESAINSFLKPLVIWLNGGPGCSSVGYGASIEIGPFRINKNASGLYLNPHAWNLAANILFLESPVGVGFSYSNTSFDRYNNGDRRTAIENLIFIIKWLKKFPQYKSRELYVTGESYAGNYVTQLAREILIHNSKNVHQAINLKGIMVGNPIMDIQYDNIGTVSYWWTHAMISDHTYDQFFKSCNFSQEILSDVCDSVFDYVSDKEIGDINPYNIYTPVCYKKVHTLTTIGSPRFLHQIFRRLSGYDPCTINYASIYYNRPDVQRSLHANTTLIPYRWSACSKPVRQNWKDSEFSVLPIYKLLIASGIKIWIYSGDTDSVVPVTATRFSLVHLKLHVTKAWAPWMVNKQVGGWTEVYEGLTFATVRGAGHQVPITRPKQALHLFIHFLKGEPLPTS